jgi:hypothetical protein
VYRNDEAFATAEFLEQFHRPTGDAPETIHNVAEHR